LIFYTATTYTPITKPSDKHSNKQNTMRTIMHGKL